MKNLALLFAGAVGLALLTSSSAPVLPSVNNKSFNIGEKLRYRVSYGFVDAGEAILEVKPTSRKGNGRSLYHVVATGRTLGGFNAFYRVDDVYESYIDQRGIFPWYFKRRVDEGGFKINQDYTFNQDRYRVVTEAGKQYKIPVGIQDMISSFYYARTMNFTNLKKGQVFTFNCFMDEEIWPLKVRYTGDEVINIRKGKFKCHKFVPVVQEGRYFTSEEDVNFWVTADENRIPILVKAKIPVGSIKMHLVEWENLKNPLSSKL